jgi:hypothetical protein
VRVLGRATRKTDSHLCRLSRSNAIAWFPLNVSSSAGSTITPRDPGFASTFRAKYRTQDRAIERFNHTPSASAWKSCAGFRMSSIIVRGGGGGGGALRRYGRIRMDKLRSPLAEILRAVMNKYTCTHILGAPVPTCWCTVEGIFRHEYLGTLCYLILVRIVRYTYTGYF